MKKIALAAFASAAALALAACNGAPTTAPTESVETVPGDTMTSDVPSEVPTEAM